MFERLKRWQQSTALQLTLSFVLLALIGSFLLAQPVFQHDGTHTSYIDHLMTAISLVCVSGMAALPIATSYNLGGQIIALLLIQVGGLGVITILNIGLFYLNRHLSLRNQYLLQQSLSRDTNENLMQFLLAIYRYTFLIEGIGTLLLMIDFVPRFGWGKGTFHALFIAVSSFTNSGFHNLYSNSLESYYANPLVLLTVSFLVMSGGLGFAVLFELTDRFKHYLVDKPRSLRLAMNNLTIHTRIVIWMSLAIVTLGTGLFLLAEWNNPHTIGNMTPLEKILNAFFNSVNTRTAGYTSIAYNQLMPFTKFTSMLQTLIGGAPGGTAGGLKVTTIAILLLLARSELRSDPRVNVYRREIPFRLVKQAVTITLFYMLLLFIGYSLLLFTHPQMDSLNVLFETANALGSAGINFNTIDYLHPVGIIVMMTLMIAGRVGPITLLLAIWQRKDKDITYAKTNIYLG